MELFKLYFYSFFLFLLTFLLIDNLNAQDMSVQGGESACKLLQEENMRLRMEIENIKAEKLEVSFTSCRAICRRIQ